MTEYIKFQLSELNCQNKLLRRANTRNPKQNNFSPLRSPKTQRNSLTIFLRVLCVLK